MTPNRLFRAFALPALAILVPSVFIAVLASAWLSLEREAARLRGAEAAAGALQELRQSLLKLVVEAGRDVWPRLHDQPQATPETDSAWPAMVAEAFVFEETGHLAPRRGAGEATAASGARAAALLANGSQALAEGRLDDAERAAVQVFACCASARDEFGVAYVTYAAWQRLAVDSRRPTAARPAAVVRDLRRAIDLGHLSQPGDVVGVRQLAENFGHVAGVVSLPLLVEQRAAAGEQSRQTARRVESWLASLEWGAVTSEAPVLVGPWRSKAGVTLVAAWRPVTGETVAMVLDPQTLGDWVSRWSAAGSSFTFALGPSPGAPALNEIAPTAPLFVETPAVTVAVLRGPVDPASDRQRATLFMTAAGAVVVLTLIAGYLATRDAFRERRTAMLRSTFMAGVTHEIKTPLTSIRLMAETLQQRRASPEAAEALLTTIVGEAEHLSALVDNVLGTARIESGTRTYRPHVVCLADVVRSARQRFEYTLTKEGFTIAASIPDAPILVHADPEALAQAVHNLLGNAAKYSGTSREIQLSVTTAGGSAMVSVSDAGVGVSKREQANIFNSFYRGRATADTTPGTGLGLALVRHFADAHGGRVTLDSVPGRGSTVLDRSAARDRSRGSRAWLTS